MQRGEGRRKKEDNVQMNTAFFFQEGEGGWIDRGTTLSALPTERDSEESVGKGKERRGRKSKLTFFNPRGKGEKRKRRVNTSRAQQVSTRERMKGKGRKRGLHHHTIANGSSTRVPSADGREGKEKAFPFILLADGKWGKKG